MASERVVLIGQTDGPWVDVSRIRNPVLRISGLQKGSVFAQVRLIGDCKRVEMTQNGEHSLHDADWVQVSASDAQKSLVCTILSAKVA